MSVYHLAPSPAIAIGENPFATWENGFTDEQIDRIREICEALELTPATLGGDIADDTIRRSETGWLELNSDSGFIYDTLGFIARQLNGQFFDFDLYGFVEHLQYTVYREDGGHYDWHVDRGVTSPSPRKLSLVLQLSDPDEYEGGDLQVFTSSEPTTVVKQKGLVAAFPSFVLHRVTPVTAGTRRTLVVWLAGPRFR